jgi:ribosomal protein L44E
LFRSVINCLAAGNKTQKKNKPYAAAEAVFVNFTKFYLRAVFTEKAEKRFRIELEKLKDTTSVRELRKAISKAKGDGESLSHGNRRVFHRRGGGVGGRRKFSSKLRPKPTQQQRKNNREKQNLRVNLF